MRQFEKLKCGKCLKVEVLERPPTHGLAAAVCTAGGGQARMSNRYEQWAHCLSPTNGSVMVFCPECTDATDPKAVQPSWAELV